MFLIARKFVLQQPRINLSPSIINNMLRKVFGKIPSGERLKKLQQSRNYKNNVFKISALRR